MQLHSTSEVLRFGAPFAEAAGAMILLHGRGSSAHEIAGLADVLEADDVAFLVPSAAEGTWYPQRFFVPLSQNEPWLTGALRTVDQAVKEVHAAGIPFDRIGLAGFSQGACLALEYVARNPRRYGFVAGLSGALIGPLDTRRASGNLQSTPVLLACAERDAHIPFEFVEKSAVTLSSLGANVTKQTFRGSAHTVFPEEVEWLKKQLVSWPSAK